MQNLDRISWRPFAIPLKQAFGAAHGTLSLREGVVIRLQTVDGLVGLGEASPLPTFVGGGVTDILPNMRRFAAAVVAHVASERPEAPAALPAGRWTGEREGMPLSVSGAVRFAFETAFISIEAERAGLPFYQWYSQRPRSGESPPSVAVASSAVPVNAVIGGVSPAVAGEQARAFVDQGYRVFKVKVGLDVAEDIQRVAAVRRAVGSLPEVRIDANGGWSFEQACDALERLRDEAVSIVEQPVPALPASDRLAAPEPAEVVSADFTAIRDLARRFPAATIAADESLGSVLALRDWVDFVTTAATDTRIGTVYKPMVLGLDPFGSVHRLAASGLPVIVTTTIDAGIATAATIHLAACLPRPRLACGLATLDLLEGDIVTGVPPIVDGQVAPAETPGLGIRLDEAALGRYATGPWQEVRG